MVRSWIAPINTAEKWITIDDILQAGDLVPIDSKPLSINNDLEVKISTDMNDAWQKCYDGIVDQFRIKKEDNEMTTTQTVKEEIEMCTKIRCPIIEKVIVNGPATIVYFDDRDRVIVKKMGVDKDDLFSAVAQAYCKKVFGSTSAFHREVLDKLQVQEPKKAKKKEKISD